MIEMLLPLRPGPPASWTVNMLSFEIAHGPIFRAVKGQQGVHPEEQWEHTCKNARQDYTSGRFLIEQLGAERFLEPKLMATLSQLRQALVAQHDPDDPAGTMLADLAVISYYNTLRIQGYIGNLCPVMERELFGQDPLRAVYGDHTGATIEDRLKRLVDQPLPLQDRANRMMVRTSVPGGISSANCSPADQAGMPTWS